mmetsp:Transcript_4960/g.7347  ORF Transcript_4960/g.7347 Transcript_4960/m.7347 type:complete len:273 (+) Transcript_4960:84-902(+)
MPSSSFVPMKSGLSEDIIFFHVSQFLDFGTLSSAIRGVSRGFNCFSFDERIWRVRALNACLRFPQENFFRNSCSDQQIRALEDRIGKKLRLDIRQALRVTSGNLDVSDWHDASYLIEYYLHQSSGVLPMDTGAQYFRIGELRRTQGKSGQGVHTAVEDALLCTKTWQVYTLCEIQGEGVVSLVGSFERWLEVLATCGRSQGTTGVQDQEPKREGSFSKTAYSAMSRTFSAVKLVYRALKNVKVEELYFGIEQEEEEDTFMPPALQLQRISVS